MKIIGYYKEPKPIDLEQDNEKYFYIVVFENSMSTIDHTKKWLECYNVMTGHQEIKDKEYLSLCKKISKEEYMKATEGWFTPREYL